MSETLKILIDFGFNDLRIHSIEANVNPKNEKSVQLLEKLNFKKEAYFRENYFFNGKFVDSIIYSLLESDLN
jgi:ribosomal-protein-alanine N-acetyltransferase